MGSNKNDIKILPEIIFKNGYRYNLLQRTPKKAFYRQTLDNVQVGFEVFLIRIRGTQFSSFLSKSISAAERFPGNEDFGRTAWSYLDFTDALKKYLEL